MHIYSIVTFIYLDLCSIEDDMFFLTINIYCHHDVQESLVLQIHIHLFILLLVLIIITTHMYLMNSIRLWNSLPIPHLLITLSLIIFISSIIILYPRLDLTYGHMFITRISFLLYTFCALCIFVTNYTYKEIL